MSCERLRADLLQHAVEQVDAAIDVRGRDVERWQAANDLLVGAVHQQTLLAGAIDDRQRVDAQLEAAHQAGAADLDDHRMLERERAKPALEVRADRADVLAESLVHQLLEEEA